MSFRIILRHAPTDRMHGMHVAGVSVGRPKPYWIDGSAPMTMGGRAACGRVCESAVGCGTATEGEAVISGVRDEPWSRIDCHPTAAAVWCCRPIVWPGVVNAWHFSWLITYNCRWSRGGICVINGPLDLVHLVCAFAEFSDYWFLTFLTGFWL